MEPILIIIRGNSGSGKTVLADALQNYFGYDNCLLLHQDIIRREILHAADHPGTATIGMIETLVNYGLKHYSITILEGILRRDVYGKMLQKLISGNDVHTYYLDVPFETTVKRDQTKNSPFGEINLKKWWREKDYLNQNDVIINSGNEKDIMMKIIKDISKK
ncbi:zeta toxin family protein [Pediococcus claussenii]|uniref:UDP-N-acetylglucosamine kinase n=1 Tax=Pediococcus claussenii (strain ATCC BAA-344 / DSM 14800 / JCM 18046 / KCTC 3811 / LMG 21948 / P06) TaxID=701521 RepID=G8PEE2_PEDCP|nr:zeta toxin family protein [Pediococcus claussenii]AEV94403.1 zeta toxin family protein [Pediococcus claussenii ATCC BAA-344]ANZ69624.1 zeta toxin family protein [Pediococcus claussenii]ANZ71441.1 zeta toxin family protein [Pediococcus claussenii]KRN19893.1 hypothetical protein IV79_GL001182 [Pediococcus claussenii]